MTGPDIWTAVRIWALCIPLAGCGADYLASEITGRDCNTAYLYDGDNFCSAPKGPPPPQPYCTKGFEGVDCWARPDLMPGVARQVAEGPTGLTPEQNRARTGP